MEKIQIEHSIIACNKLFFNKYVITQSINKNYKNTSRV